MNKPRSIETLIDPQPVVEGAGVHLKRSIATRTLNYLDPFLLFDHFASRDRHEYEAGFPLHPHRGIETVTYMLTGEVQHRDTLGNAGIIGPGDVQWMTAGRAIMHEEMPQVKPEGIDGFQLWVNLPSSLKMTQPRYQDLSAGVIPRVEQAGGAMVRVIAGELDGICGPVTGIAADPLYMDVLVPPHSAFAAPVPPEHNVFCYVFEGKGMFGQKDRKDGEAVSATRLITLTNGTSVEVYTAESPVRFLLAAGKPLNEPVARYGPFVMNTKAEIEKTLEELRNGTFL